uniref:Uncharacterized protein n=1 Tax=Anopheles epiroticus TaxID=199890 RepID=A0A240PPX3_9DIPT
MRSTALEVRQVISYHRVSHWNLRMSALSPHLLLLCISIFATLTTGVLCQTDDPFEDETNQCQISVTPEMLASIADSVQADVPCDDLWNTVLLHYHQTRTNLSDCLERAATEPTSDPSSTFCQLLLDDAQRQMEQDHRKYAAGMEEKLHTAQQETQEQREARDALQQQLNALVDSRNELYLDLLLANIAIGETNQALSYYALQPASLPTEKLHEQIVRFIYRVTLNQDQRLLNLITFIRGVKERDERLSLFRLTKREIQKRPSQRDGYMAAVFALNAREDSAVYQADQGLYRDLAEPLEKRWKEQLLNGTYKEVINFAWRQPKYFQQLQNTFASIDAGQKFDRYVPYVNSLPKAEPRLESLRVIVEQIRNRNKNTWHNQLVLTARQVDICETFISKTKSGTDSVKKLLEELKKQFSTFNTGKNYQFYLAESRKKSG